MNSFLTEGILASVVQIVITKEAVKNEILRWKVDR